MIGSAPLITQISKWLYDDGSANRRLKVAAETMQCATESAENLKTMTRRIEDVIQLHPDIELIMFGEMILGHYAPGSRPDYHHAVSEPVPGNATRAMGSLAAKHGIFICFGMSEEKDGLLFNTQVLINPRGEIQTIHRKWNLKWGEMQAGYQPGDSAATFTSINDVKTGLMICSDAAHPRTMHMLLRNRPELILFSLADDEDKDWFVAKTNARLYNAWMVSANRYGQEPHYWNGHTVISDPLGTLRATSVHQESTIVFDLGFDDKQGIMTRLVRTLWVKVPLLLHIVTHLKTLLSYYK